ncbi:MAG: AAA family ATPase [Verrucomicrobiota bacterium]
MPALHFRSGPHAGDVLDLSSGRQINIGRNESNDIVVPEIKVSGEHARVFERDDHWIIDDLGSSNGTRINGEKIETARLHPGDVIDLGKVIVIEFHEDINPDKIAKEPEDMEASDGDLALVEEAKKAFTSLRKQVRKIIVGQDLVVEQVLTAVLARGHALLVGVPGLAKTLLVNTLSQALDLEFKRIQFTPDLLPSDITGTEILEDGAGGQRDYNFKKGPLFANMILADEINRTPPKTQSALLEAMQERHVTAGENTYPLPDPFFVLATQNPIEQEGTYPLPEAQLDRFLCQISVSYPSAFEEEQIVRFGSSGETPKIDPVLDAETLIGLQSLVRRILVGDPAVTYAANIARATRPKEKLAPKVVQEMVSWGAGPRAGISLVTAAKARALLEGRFHVTTGDIRAVAPQVLRHRLVLTFAAEADDVAADEIVAKILDEVPS